MSIRPSGETTEYRRGYDAGYKAAMDNADEATRLRALAKQAFPSFRDLTDDLAALAGAEPVAWDFPVRDEPAFPGDPMRGIVYDASEANRLHSKGYEVRPLYTHAPAKAREDGEARFARGQGNSWAGGGQTTITFDGVFSIDLLRSYRLIPVDAALATFAEGSE